MAGNADRVLVYLVLFITDILQVCCLGPICSSNADVCFFFLLQVCAKINDKSEAAKKLNTLSLESFIVPGEKNFVLGGMYAPAGRDQGMSISLLFFVAFSYTVLQRLSANTSRSSAKRLSFVSLTRSTPMAPLASGGSALLRSVS